MSEGYWAYIGTKPCGCSVAAVVDLPDNPTATAESIADYVKQGLAVQRRWIAPQETVPIKRCRCEEQPGLEDGA